MGRCHRRRVEMKRKICQRKESKSGVDKQFACFSLAFALAGNGEDWCFVVLVCGGTLAVMELCH